MRRIFTLLIAFLLPVSVFATVCRLPNLHGFEDARARAEAILPPKTNDISKLAIYVERDPSLGLYFQSNFVSEGAENVTKIGGEASLTDLEWAAQNLVWTEQPDFIQRQEVQDAIRQLNRVYIDKSVFDEDGLSSLNLEGISDFTIIDREARVSTAGITINRDRPPPLLAERIAGCCLNGRPIGKGIMLAQALTELKSSPKDTRIISLVSDSATIATAKEVGLEGKALMNMADRSAADLQKVFEGQSGKQVVVLGHVESGNFVVRDAGGSEKSRVAISHLRKLASDNNVLLIEVGCNTASVGDTVAGLQVGVTTRFNTVEATRKLSKAIDATNMSEFLQRLADQDLKVVVESEAIENIIRYRANYFISGEFGSPDISVAEVSITPRSSGILGSWTPNWMRRMFN
ncbi:hypothetical protein GGE16_001512 [Rhizobium leguminosarum]|uniref:Uncharacterized protein n=1 Tax=Rhizobium leguminosarum TaxID=384 RepID=A0AAE2SVF0_RHILE|nr:MULTISPECIES: hypothetical protein [Rhizobium]MBB4289496.1 hypothetical protein [Rhizobium leguminosarum]MBB4294408.1 hypothetical protein [Rhizobium leguminosarum]MBB4305804.1 hypothetical protein [Rhizobium leguminosarum]MBB4418619.1 hypothetical protein [Rhizobium leguminosarum]MBB4433463.1 hypothetical protein [Rhizobium esperanzae]